MIITLETSVTLKLTPDEVLLLRNYLRNPPADTPIEDLPFLQELFETLPFSDTF